MDKLRGMYGFNPSAPHGVINICTTDPNPNPVGPMFNLGPQGQNPRTKEEHPYNWSPVLLWTNGETYTHVYSVLFMPAEGNNPEDCFIFRMMKDVEEYKVKPFIDMRSAVNPVIDVDIMERAIAPLYSLSGVKVVRIEEVCVAGAMQYPGTQGWIILCRVEGGNEQQTVGYQELLYSVPK